MSEPSINTDLASEALQSIALHVKADPFAFQKFNTAQVRLLRALKDPKPGSLTIVLFLKPNRVGGSRVTIAALSAVMFGTQRPAAQSSPFGAFWPFPVKSARILSTAETLGDQGPIQKAMRDLFPAGKYQQSRGVGKSYNSAGKTDDEFGWDWDIMSYGQDALSAAGSTKGLIIMSEPPPHDLYVECLTRLGGNGLLLLECTQLDLAPFLEEIAEEADGKIVDGIQYGSLRLDGKVVGEIRVVRGDIEESCIEHHNGHQSHSAIEATIAGWPAEEREARKTGKPLHLSGRIYPQYGEANRLEALDDFHLDCIEKKQFFISSIIDPADRKPWFCSWFLTFPNEDVVAFAEWPPFNYGACKASPVVDIESYRGVLLESEAQMPAPVKNHYIDGLFGAAIKSGRGLNILQMLRAACPGCTKRQEECKHKLDYKQAPAYDGSVRDGHILVRDAIGDLSKGDRPKFFVLKNSCPNLDEGMRKYAWKENRVTDKGLSSVPALVWKDGADTVRMHYLAGLHRWPVEPTPTVIIPRRRR